MVKHKKLNYIFVGFLMAISPLVQAEIAVIVNSQSEIKKLELSEVKNIFLGKRRILPDGNRAAPAYLNEQLNTQQEFRRKILKKSAEQLKLFWSRKVLSGKSEPPLIFDNAEAVKSYVVKTNGGIGFVNANELDKSVKAVFVFK